MVDHVKGILFFDVDGTLVNTEGNERQPSAMTMQSIRKAQDNGYLCFIASGRNYKNLDDLLNLGMDGFVYADGAGIILPNGKELFSPMPEEQVKQLIHEIDDLCEGGVCLATRDTHFFSQRQYDYFYEIAKSYGEAKGCGPEVMLDKFGVQLLEEWNHEDVLEIDVCFTTAENEQKWIAMKDSKNQYVHTGDTFGSLPVVIGEVTDDGVTKASGCRRVMEYYGLTMEDAIAFGDSMNDREMLEEVGMGIAMGNADKALYPYANMITETVGNEGITVALKKLGIID